MGQKRDGSFGSLEKGGTLRSAAETRGTLECGSMCRGLRIAHRWMEDAAEEVMTHKKTIKE